MANRTIWTSFIIDRTDAARQEAEESSRSLASIVTCSNDAIFGEKLDGTVTTWNAGAEAEAIYGYSAEEIVGKSIAVAIPPEGLDQFRMVMQKSGTRRASLRNPSHAKGWGDLPCVALGQSHKR
jgi:PAS domain-containing protein